MDQPGIDDGEDAPADEIDELIRNVTVEVYRKNNVILTAVGVYSLNTGDNEAARMREAVRAAVLSNEYILQFHGFPVT